MSSWPPGVFIAAPGGEPVRWRWRGVCRGRASTSLRPSRSPTSTRPGTATPTVVLSLGLGLCLLVTLSLIDGNIHHQLAAAMPEKAPAFFFIDIPGPDAPRFNTFVASGRPARRPSACRCCADASSRPKDVPVEALKPAEGPAWVLSGDRGITFAALPEGSRWSRANGGRPITRDRRWCRWSSERRRARLKPGDPITVNVLGRNVMARSRQLRTARMAEPWHQFRAGVLARRVQGRARHRHRDADLADGANPAEETALVKALADAFPTTLAIRVKDALDMIDHLVGNLVLGLRGASSIALIAAALVLGGALAAGQRFRIYDAVILKTLGATRPRLVMAYALEYLLIGLAAVIFGVAAGSITAALVITRVMEFSFVWMFMPALATAVLALLVTVVLGLIGTFSALGHKPAEVLRNL